MVIDTEKPGVATFTHDPMEDIFSALQLGVSDYFAKSGQTRAIVGLTGGVDAAVVAAIATSALGKENVMGIYLPTAKGSPETLEDARALARNLGIVFHEIAIEEVMSVLRKTLEPHLPGVLPEENIEDRV